MVALPGLDFLLADSPDAAHAGLAGKALEHIPDGTAHAGPLHMQAGVYPTGVGRQALQVGAQAGPITLPCREFVLRPATLR